MPHELCEGGMPERRVITRCVGVWKNYITIKDFFDPGQNRERRREPAEVWLDVMSAQGCEEKKGLKRMKLTKLKVYMIPEERRSALQRQKKEKKGSLAKTLVVKKQIEAKVTRYPR